MLDPLAAPASHGPDKAHRRIRFHTQANLPFPPPPGSIRSVCRFPPSCSQPQQNANVLTFSTLPLFPPLFRLPLGVSSQNPGHVSLEIAVIGGAGMMGKLIGAEFALCGHRVVLYDRCSTARAPSPLCPFFHHCRRRLLPSQHMRSANMCPSAIRNCLARRECSTTSASHRKTACNTGRVLVL